MRSEEVVRTFLQNLFRIYRKQLITLRLLVAISREDAARYITFARLVDMLPLKCLLFEHRAYIVFGLPL